MSNMSVLLFKGVEAYVSGKFGWTVNTGQSVVVPREHADHLIEKFPGDWELVDENGDAVLAEEIVKAHQPFDGMPVDEDEEPDELGDIDEELVRVFSDDPAVEEISPVAPEVEEIPPAYERTEVFGEPLDTEPVVEADVVEEAPKGCKSREG